MRPDSRHAPAGRRAPVHPRRNPRALRQRDVGAANAYRGRPGPTLPAEGQEIHRRRTDEVGNEHAKPADRRSPAAAQVALSCRGSSGRSCRPSPWLRAGRGSRRPWSPCSRSCSARSSPHMTSRNSASSAPSGSSIMNACGSRTIARPSATRCRSPLDSPDTGGPADGRCAGCVRPPRPASACRLRDMPWTRSG